MFQRTKQKLTLINTDDSSSFWVNGGGVLRNLKDLKDALVQMGEDTFKYHVNAEKNDFAAWVKEILKDEVLAGRILKSKTAKAAAKAIETRLKRYGIE